MRKKKHGEERILACAELLIQDPTLLKDEPSVPFADKSKPLCLEIGCGKGNFAVGMAQKHPEDNFIAMERVPDVCCIALEKAMACKDTRPDNLRFIIGNADNLEEWFPEKCLDRIYLNFSDPWPKAGHAKRRLTHRIFLERYKNLTETIMKNEKMCALCYTQLYDVEQERNGLMTYDRKFKFDPEFFYKVNTQKAAIEEQ